MNDNTNQERLQDIKCGKVIPWRAKKVANVRLSESYERLDNENKAQRTKSCGSYLEFEKNPETGEKWLKSAMFCQVRLCPMCQWRRSLKVFRQLSRVMDEVQRCDENLVPVFLTLTVRNCGADELSDVLNRVLSGWRNLYNHYALNKIIEGWFRCLEITYNRKTDTYHPHIHAILFVDKGYFKSKDYKPTAEWVRLWRTSAGLDYDPVCDIRKVSNVKGKYKAVAEVAKYTVKDSDYLTWDEELTDGIVATLDKALHRKRLYAYGGILKKIAKEFDIDKPGEGDLVHIDDDVIREDVATLLETYRWSFGLGDYFRQEKRVVTESLEIAV